MLSLGYIKTYSTTLQFSQTLPRGSVQKSLPIFLWVSIQFIGETFAKGEKHDRKISGI